MENRLPNLIIAGVSKAGTTSLFSYLSKHPDICVSSIKETRYFLPLIDDKELKPVDEYKKYFCHCNNHRYILEATPEYYYGGIKVARAIYEQLGLIKIIIILRNPVDRLFSFYKYLKGITLLPRNITFDEYVRLCNGLSKEKHYSFRVIQGGFYDDYLDDWYAIFDNSIKIVFFENMNANPYFFMSELCSWLDIDKEVYSYYKFSVENKSTLYKNKLIHKLAININKRFEKFFRRYSDSKKVIRDIYYFINRDSKDETISDYTYSYLDSLYEEHNKRLLSKLLLRGYSNLPSWLIKKT